MNYIRLVTAFFILLLSTSIASAQFLKAGFDSNEYKEMLRIAMYQAYEVDKWNTITDVDAPSHFKQAYRSPEMGLDNRWDLWLYDPIAFEHMYTGVDIKVAVISTRGTTAENASWLANLYAAMVPAKGSLNVSDDYTFNYQLSDDDKAGVHIGWLLAMAYLSRDMLPRIDSCYKAGYRDFILTGHSQGAGITFLLTSHLYHLQRTGRIPQDIRFKTYCSAAPKPGNLYYAYSYENDTRAGWGYTVVNAADWVPEVPISIQTENDFNRTSIFRNAKGFVKGQKFPKNIALGYVYKKLTKPAKKARKQYKKYLGNMVSKFVTSELDGFEPPKEYFNSNNYSRTGSMIVLYPKADYYQRFPDNSTNIWEHHFIPPYMYLMQH